jgi:tetratricopeptide (TPR) repeat protein
MDYKKANTWVAWIIFGFVFVIYAMTVARTVSYWDCGEFIAASYKLAVPHPPGAPFYLLLGRLFSMVPFVSDIAYRVNYISVFSSAFTVMLLYLTIVHLVREWKGGKLESDFNWKTAIFSGAMGSLTFAFTHSFWFNAVEAEVYAPSMLFTALIVWLIMVWAEKSDQPGSDKYILMIAYIIGLAIGVHLLNVLALPFVTLIIYYKKFPYTLKSFLINVGITIAIVLVIYPGIVKYLPLIANYWGVFGLVVFFVLIIWLVVWSMNNNKTLISLASLSVLLIIIGYSTYTMIYIRSNLDPMIDENNPETIEKFIKYLNREQYGDHSITNRTKVWKESPNGKNYSSVADYIWNYQINKMYVRYFLWQFVGMDDDEVNWGWDFFALPFFLGMLGIYWHFRHDPKHALSVMALFIMTGIAVIVYLNQPDPQPRERDYSYVGSFFAFSIWIGLGFAGMMEIIKSLKDKDSESVGNPLMVGTFVVLLAIIPLHMLAKNYDSHDRSGRYIAWDYSYNMLQSCEPNAILFTNGDNDTFPLWYLQEVAEVRTDIRIVNLSLLNTPWYVQQLKDLEPKVPITYSDEDIERLQLMRWDKAQVLEIPVPEDFGQQQYNEYTSAFGERNIEVPKSIKFRVKPQMKIQNTGLLRVQDLMILHILHANKWKKPIYFAVTVAKSNMLDELQQYMRMDGLALKIVPYNNWKISPENLERNLTEVYKYRGLNDGDVHYDKNILGLLQNYRTAYLQVADYHTRQNNDEKVDSLLSKMDEQVSAEVIPWSNKYLTLLRDSYTYISNPVKLDSFVQNSSDAQELQIMAEQLYRLGHPEKAIPIFESLFESDPKNVQALSFLINLYEKTKQYQKGIDYLEKWIAENPNDKQATVKLSQMKQRLKS